MGHFLTKIWGHILSWKSNLVAEMIWARRAVPTFICSWLCESALFFMPASACLEWCQQCQWCYQRAGWACMSMNVQVLIASSICSLRSNHYQCLGLDCVNVEVKLRCIIVNMREHVFRIHRLFVMSDRSVSQYMLQRVVQSTVPHLFFENVSVQCESKFVASTICFL